MVVRRRVDIQVLVDVQSTISERRYPEIASSLQIVCRGKYQHEGIFEPPLLSFK